MRHPIRTLGCIGLFAGLSLSPLREGDACAQPPSSAAKPAPTGAVRETRIGSIHISGYTRITGTIGGASSARFLGPRTLIETTEKSSDTAVRLHADDIRASQDKNGVQIDLSGSVRCTLIQAEKGGDRVLEGTAGRGVYNQQTRRIELTGGVRTTLTDPTRLNGPGTLRADHLVIDIGAKPYLYTLEGDPGNNDIQFTPLGSKVEKNGAENRTPYGTTHIFGYQSGSIQIGKGQAGQSARFSGPGTTIAIANATDIRRGTFQAERITASFAEDGSVRQAEAAGSVRYHVERPLPNSSETQVITGTAGRATYNADEALIRLTGGVQAEIAAPDVLQSPAQVRAGRVLVKTAQPFRYEVSGGAATNLFRFTPRRPEETPEPGKPALRKFDVGTVTVRQFERGVFEAGKEVVFAGSQMTFQTADEQAKTSLLLAAPRVAATFSEKNVLESAQATGSVRFQVRQPSASGKTMQSVQGTARAAQFTNTAQTKLITVQGPWRAVVNAPEYLKEPAKTTGEEGDTLAVDVASNGYPFDLRSENGTATLELWPLEVPGEEGKSPTPPAPDKK
jgi:lipopolysaccharide export system protein LptA